jgi:hypothetical protein
MYLEKPKRLIIWNGWSIYEEYKVLMQFADKYTQEAEFFVGYLEFFLLDIPIVLLLLITMK